MLNPSLNHSPLSVRMRFATVLSALCLLLPFAAQRLPGQNLSLTGIVYDLSGAPVPNATVIMTEHKTNRVKMTTSGGEGYFAFAALPVVGYEMKVVKPGFAEYNVPQMALEPNRESSQNVTLNPASVMEEVDVICAILHNCGAVWLEDDCESISGNGGNGVFDQTWTTRV